MDSLEQFWKYFSFRGRASREEFIRSFLLLLAGAFIGGMIEGFLKSKIFGLIFALIIAWPVIALVVRRLHDTGRSGWSFFIGFIPIAGQIALYRFLLQEGSVASTQFGADQGYSEKDFSTESNKSEEINSFVGNVASESNIVYFQEKQDYIIQKQNQLWWISGGIALFVLLIFVSFSWLTKDKGAQGEKMLSTKAISIKEALEKSTRPALKGDVEGKWEMIYQKNDGKYPDSHPFIYSYQRFHFLTDGYVKTMGASKPFDEMSMIVWEHGPKPSTKYEFVEPGVLFMTGGAGDTVSIFVTMVETDLPPALAVDGPVLRKGDLVFSYVALEKQSQTPSSYLIRYFRKMNDD